MVFYGTGIIRIGQVYYLGGGYCRPFCFGLGCLWVPINRKVFGRVIEWRRSMFPVFGGKGILFTFLLKKVFFSFFVIDNGYHICYYNVKDNDNRSQ